MKRLYFLQVSETEASQGIQKLRQVFWAGHKFEGGIMKRRRCLGQLSRSFLQLLPALICCVVGDVRCFEFQVG